MKLQNSIELTDDGSDVLLRLLRSALEHASPTVLVVLVVIVVVALDDHDGRPAGRLAVLRIALGGLAVLAVVKTAVELRRIVVKGLDVNGAIAVHFKLGRLGALLLGLDGGGDEDEEEKEEGKGGGGGGDRGFQRGHFER